MNDIVSLMQNIGFSQYEARVYLALLQQPQVSGYEIAKISGVPASKIYAVLSKLVNREAVIAIDDEPVKYVPKPPDEILSHLKSDYLNTVGRLNDELEKIYEQHDPSDQYIWNISGREAIIERIIEFLKKGNKQIFLSVWDEEIDLLADTLKELYRQGVELHIVHFGQKILGFGKEYRHGREHEIRIKRGGRRIAVVVDDKQVILGHFSEDEKSSAAWTSNSGLVLLAKDYIIHDIYSIRMIEKFGKEAEDILKEF
jgi:sugar-specific transcriptional regulator TrmB